MTNSIIDTIKKVMAETKSGHMVWHEIENTYCLKSVYKNKPIVICRYPDENNKKVASFNYLSEDDFVIHPFNQWTENEDGYDIISELYESACRTTPTACE